MVNTFDMLNRWSKRRFLCVLHQAYNLLKTERYAIPYFCLPGANFPKVSLTTCTSAGNSHRFHTQTLLKHFDAHNSRTYHRVNKELKEIA